MRSAKGGHYDAVRLKGGHYDDVRLKPDTTEDGGER